MTGIQLDARSREHILDAVAAVLRDQKRAANEMQEVAERSGVAFDAIAAEFNDTDEIMLAVGRRITNFVVSKLEGETADADSVKARLLEFCKALHAAYASELVGLYRVFMTESSRRKELRARFYEHGPHAIFVALQRFLAAAQEKGIVRFEDCGCAAEHLMGLLREPLYRELALHSSGIGTIDMDPVSSLDIFWNGCARKKGAHGSAG